MTGVKQIQYPALTTMSINDWKAALQGLDLPNDTDTPAETSAAVEQSPRETARIEVAMERKGRGGKTATIIAGFTIADDEVAKIAATLKTKLGTGGSARGGEILIQGDRRDDAVRMLKEMGLKVHRSN